MTKWMFVAAILMIGMVPFGSILNAQASDSVSQAPAASPVEDVIYDSEWYDAKKKSIVPIPVKSVVDDSLNRNSRWLPKPKAVKKPNKPQAAGGGGGGGGTGFFGSGLTIGNLFGWLLLVLILAVAITALVFGLSKAEIELAGGSKQSSASDELTPDVQMIERMKHLPPELRRTDVNPRSEAKRLMDEGLYDQAIILLFGHQLLLLDRHGQLRLNRGKTNRRYLRECRGVDAVAANHLRLTVEAFERSYFGKHELTKAEFDTLWPNNLELEKLIDSRKEVAA